MATKTNDKAVAGKRRVIIDNDGCDVFLCEGSSYEQFTALRFAGLAGTGATTVFYTPQSVGLNRFTHNTRVGTVITDGETVFARNIAPALIARGTDCFEYAIRFCRAHELEIFFGMRMNDTHDAGRHYNLDHNALKREHPECLLGTKENRPRHGAWTALNYLCAPVRDMAFRLLEEACRNYDLDGLHLDFFRHPVFFPNPAGGGHASAAETAAMTGLMRDIRAMARHEGEKRGRPILLSTRVPDSVPYALFLGLDLQTWLSEGLVDLLCTSSYLQLNGWEYSAGLGHTYGVPVYPSLDETRLRDETANRLRTEAPGMRARCANAFAAGCDGVLLFNYIFDAAKDTPERYRLIGELGDDSNFPPGPKRYFASVRGVGSVAGGAPDHLPHQQIPTLNPGAPIEANPAANIPIFVGAHNGGPAQARLWLEGAAEFELLLDGKSIGRAHGPEAALPLQGNLAGRHVLTVRAQRPVKVLDAAIFVDEA